MARLRDLRPKVAGLFAYAVKTDQAPLLRTAAAVFAKAGWKVLAVPVLRTALGSEAHGYAPAANLSKRASLLVSLGGDGTLLGAARLAAPLGRPVLGVNLGGLGFMTAFGPRDLDAELGELLKGACRMEERRLVRAVVIRSGRQIAVLDALNDLVLARSGAGRLARMEATVNGRFLGSFRADGLIFASPTGSTAYALSVGGPVVDARTPVLVLALVAPHTLSNRPLVLRESSVLELDLPDGDLELAADGRHALKLRAGDHVRLQRSPYHASLVLPSGHDAWAVLRDKLGWQGQTRPVGGRRA